MSRKKLRGIIIVGVVLFLLIGIVLIVARMSIGSKDHSVSATLNGVEIEWQKTSAEALSTPGDAWDYQCLSFEDNDLQKIVVVMQGQTSGKALNGSSSFSLTKVVGVSDFNVDGLDFWYDLNETDFTVGEIVLVTVRFIPDQGEATTRYFSFKVCESQIAETDTETESTAESTDKSVEETSSTTSATIYFNGLTVSTYPTEEEALNSAYTGINMTSCTIKATVGSNVKRVRVWTEDTNGTSNGDEYILWEDNNWISEIPVSEYAGQTIIVCVSVADNSTPPVNTYEYFVIQVAD